MVLMQQHKKDVHKSKAGCTSTVFTIFNAEHDFRKYNGGGIQQTLAFQLPDAVEANVMSQSC